MSPAQRSVPGADAGGGKLALERNEKSAPSGTALAVEPKQDENCVSAAKPKQGESSSPQYFVLAVLNSATTRTKKTEICAKV